jgi:hypothetical protein
MDGDSRNRRVACVTNLPRSSGRLEIWEALGNEVLGTLEFVPTTLSAIVWVGVAMGVGDEIVYGV